MFITPNTLINITNAALRDIVNHKNEFSDETLEGVRKLIRFLWAVHWDEPNEEVIMIDEKPF